MNLMILYSKNCKKIRFKILEGKPSFFSYTAQNIVLTLSLFIFISLLLHNFIIFLPECFFPLLNVLIPSLAHANYNA